MMWSKGLSSDIWVDFAEAGFDRLPLYTVNVGGGPTKWPLHSSIIGPDISDNSVYRLCKKNILRNGRRTEREPGIFGTLKW